MTEETKPTGGRQEAEHAQNQAPGQAGQEQPQTEAPQEETHETDRKSVV